MIKAIITDFDGTLVDTFDANLRAYQEAFAAVGRTLTEEQYRERFGDRFDRFTAALNIFDDKELSIIKETKKTAYPKYFSFLRPNTALINLLLTFKAMGGKIAIASTARTENLMNALTHLGLADKFDLILSGADVKQGKPNPEIYLTAMSRLGVSPSEVLIFEDSPVGIQAAQASGAQYIKVKI